MCRYCESDGPLNLIVYGDADLDARINVKIENSKTLTMAFLLGSRVNVRREVEISYCPMCGRPLTYQAEMKSKENEEEVATDSRI